MRSTTMINGDEFSSRRIFLRVLTSVILFLSVGCGVNNGSQDKDMLKKAIPVIQQINQKYFSLFDEGVGKIQFECKSSIVESSVSRIQDNILREQMTKSKTFVYWNSVSGFGIRITDVPDLPIPEHDKRLKLFMDAAKDRILGAFMTLSFVFNGISPRDVDSLSGLVETEDGIVLEFRERKMDMLYKYHFDNDLILREVEQIQNNKLVAVLTYVFTRNGQKEYLDKIVMSSQLDDAHTEIELKYRDFNKIIAPSQIVIRASDGGGHEVTDDIAILGIEV